MKFLIIVLVLKLVSVPLNSQQPSINNLVFEGAGIRGIAYAGVVKELELHLMMDEVKNVGGTSAGAIIAMMISLGYTGNEMADVIGSTNFRKLNDGGFLFAGGISRLTKHFGYYRGNRLNKFLYDLVEKKAGNGNLTFKELSQKGFKSLAVTGINLNKQELVIFSEKTFPDMRIRDAVRMSAGIPFYYEPLYMNTDGEVSSRKKNEQGWDMIVDGGFLGNFPIRIFDTLLPDGSRWLNPGTLGFRIDTDQQISVDNSGKRDLANLPIRKFNEYVVACYSLILENLNRQPLDESDWKRTVSISDGNISPRIRKLSGKEIGTLIENGRSSTRSYINEHLLKSESAD